MRYLFLLPLLLAGCATPRVSDADVDTAARNVQQRLDAPGRLLAAAALAHAETGQFPATAFDLLSTDAAARTGAQALRLSRLEPNAARDGFSATFSTPAVTGGEAEQRAARSASRLPAPDATRPPSASPNRATAISDAGAATSRSRVRWRCAR